MKKNDTNKMLTIEEINKEIVRGDQKLISQITGFTTDYVGMVLRGDRRSQRVLEVANEVIANRESLIERLTKKTLTSK